MGSPLDSNVNVYLLILEVLMMMMMLHKLLFAACLFAPVLVTATSGAQTNAAAATNTDVTAADTPAEALTTDDTPDNFRIQDLPARQERILARLRGLREEVDALSDQQEQKVDFVPRPPQYEIPLPSVTILLITEMLDDNRDVLLMRNAVPVTDTELRAALLDVALNRYEEDHEYHLALEIMKTRNAITDTNQRKELYNLALHYAKYIYGENMLPEEASNRSRLLLRFRDNVSPSDQAMRQRLIAMAWRFATKPCPHCRQSCLRPKTRRCQSCRGTGSCFFEWCHCPECGTEGTVPNRLPCVQHL